MLAEDEHEDHSLCRHKVTDIKGVRQIRGREVLSTDRLSPQPSPLTELNYSAAHNITSFIREFNSAPQMGYTHTPMQHILMHLQ